MKIEVVLAVFLAVSVACNLALLFLLYVVGTHEKEEPRFLDDFSPQRQSEGTASGSASKSFAGL